MSVSKKICSVHRFSYDGGKCPFCEKERIDGLARMFTKPSVEKEEERGITKSDLEKLKEKFNKKR